MAERKKKEISIPSYSLGEELFNAISHGFGALLSIAALVLMLIRARNALEVTTAAIFGTSMIFLYTISCVYHALSPGLRGKKVLRVLDHCSVFLLVFGTYIPASLLGVSGVRYQLAAVICQLLSGWSILMGVCNLRASAGLQGLIWMIAGGAMYTIGAILYGIGKNRKYCHSVFHVFCLLGTFCHFWAIYKYLL